MASSKLGAPAPRGGGRRSTGRNIAARFAAADEGRRSTGRNIAARFAAADDDNDQEDELAGTETDEPAGTETETEAETESPNPPNPYPMPPYPKGNAEEVAALFKEKAEEGRAQAQYCYGICLFDGFGVDKNPIEAAEWFEKAVEQGHAKAQ